MYWSLNMTLLTWCVAAHEWYGAKGRIEPIGWAAKSIGEPSELSTSPKDTDTDCVHLACNHEMRKIAL